VSSESELYIRPIDLRSWGETSRLLAVLGSFDLEAYIRDELDRCAFLMIEPRGALLARIVPLANELGIVSATLEGTSGRLERVLLAGKRSALEQFAIRLGTIEEQWGRRLRRTSAYRRPAWIWEADHSYRPSSTLPPIPSSMGGVIKASKWRLLEPNRPSRRGPI